jgi:hypothetical protein
VSCQYADKLICLPCSVKFSSLCELEASGGVIPVKKVRKHRRNIPLGIDLSCPCVQVFSNFNSGCLSGVIGIIQAQIDSNRRGK